MKLTMDNEELKEAVSAYVKQTYGFEGTCTMDKQGNVTFEICKTKPVTKTTPVVETTVSAPVVEEPDFEDEEEDSSVDTITGSISAPKTLF